MYEADLQFLHGSHTPRCDARVDKIFQGYQTIQYMTQGSVELFYDSQRHLLQGQWFWPAWQGPVIRFHPAPGRAWWEHRYIAFQGRLARQWFNAGLFPTQPQAAPRLKEHAQAFDQMTAMALAPGRWNQLRAINMLEALLLELAQARHENTHDHPFIHQVTDRLNDAITHAGSRHAQSIDYARIARDMGMGLSTLRRRFAQAAGVPMHQWVTQRRIAMARQWLGETNIPLKAIAYKLGYRDVYFFTRQFTQKVGVPPGAYRTSRQH